MTVNNYNFYIQFLSDLTASDYSWTIADIEQSQVGKKIIFSLLHDSG